ncbi:MAG: MATE family efflux transporter [Eubacteriales bacterium]|nr:MATE family efflux transporter [Eubacteriales bacterium]
MKNNREKILHGNMRSVLLSLALPVMAANAIQTIYGLADTFWVSKLADGDIAVAAVSYIGPMVGVAIALGIGMNIAGISMISQFVGLGRENEPRKVAGQLVSFSFFFSVVLGILGLLFGKQLLAATGAEGLILEYGWEYLQAVFLGGPAMFVFFAFQSIKQGQGDTLTPMLLAGASVILNIILDPVFMFTFDLGIAGAAWATVVTRALSTVVGMYLLFFTDNGLRLNLGDLRFNSKIMGKIVKIGLPSGFGQSIEGIGFMIMNSFVLSFGDYTVAAFGIGNRINNLIFMPAMGLGSALAAVVGQNLGANQIDRAVKAVKESIFLSVTIMATGAVAMFFAAPHIIKIFSQHPLVLEQGTYYLRLISMSIPLMGIFQAFVGCFQGSGHTLMAMLVTTGRLWALRLPMIILFKYFTPLAEKSVWFAMVGSNLLTCVFAFFLFLSGRWKQKVVDEKEDYIGDLELS